MVAFAIGRALGPAVTRNKLRRRLRAILVELDRQGLVPSALMLIGATPAAKELTFDQLRQNVVDLLSAMQASRTATPPRITTTPTPTASSPTT